MTCYFFTNTRRGYTQYPQDYLENSFKSYGQRFDSEAQIVAYRTHNLMHYTYMRRISDREPNNYFGLSIIINGLETNNIKSLFRLFEKVFQELVSYSIIVYMGDNGEIHYTDQSLSSISARLDYISQSIENLIKEGKNFFYPIRPLNYSVSDEPGFIHISESDDSIRTALNDYNTVFIQKGDTFSSPHFNGLQIRISNLYEQLEYQKSKKNELEKMLKEQHSSKMWKVTAIILFFTLVTLIALLLYGYWNRFFVLV